MRLMGDLAKMQLIKMKKEIVQLQTRLDDRQPFQKKQLDKAVDDYKLSIKRCIGLAPGSPKAIALIEEAD